MSSVMLGPEQARHPRFEVGEGIASAHACAQDFAEFLQRELVRQNGRVRGEHRASRRMVEMVVRQREPEKRAHARILQRGAEFLRQGDVLLRVENDPALRRVERACVRVSALADECVDALGKLNKSRIRMIRYIQSLFSGPNAPLRRHLCGEGFEGPLKRRFGRAQSGC